MIIKNEIVETYFMNFDGQLSIYGIVNYIEEASASLLDEIGYNNFIMKNRYNLAWVITKNKIEFYNKAFWHDNVVIKSYISKINKITLELEVIILNKNNDIIVKSKLELCVIDLEKRKIKRLNEININENILINPSNFIDDFCQIDDNNLNYLKTINVEALDIDMSLHTNNKIYFRYVLNCYNVSKLKKGIKSIELHYLKESKENDEINIYKNINNGDNIFLFSNEKKILEAKIIFSE